MGLKPKTRGRPVKFEKGERTRGPLTVRLRDKVRDELEKSAIAAGRSLSEEMEHRLELSLAQRDQIIGAWGPDIFEICQRLALSVWQIEALTGKRWFEDARTYKLFKFTVLKIIENFRQIIAQEFAESGPRSSRLTLDQPAGKLATALADLVGAGLPIWAKESEEKRRARRATALQEFHDRLKRSGARPFATGDES